MAEQVDTFTCPVPLMMPFGVKVNAAMVQNVWETYVKPEQDAGIPQSGEMRVLMAILRAVHEGLSGVPDTGG